MRFIAPPDAGSNVQPFSPMHQCVIETEIALSSAFSSQMINVRCAPWTPAVGEGLR
jgi:hypothetical protein